MNRLITLLVILVLSIVILVLYKYDSKKHVDNRSPLISLTKETYKIRVIRVMSGHEFDLTLQNERRIFTRLKVKTPPEAKDKIVAYINQSSNPEIVVYDKNDDAWLVDIVFESGSLTDWLITQKLVWEN